ncbi:hypothetical protein BKA70DRAFT_293024 [Coprinopsis sp. MPI-PUGE-AT-0042]|nr:hypothetical protein BKA70DRAFT_293024 [Coprinopsis sp. MPI-PUGE-AT-0042]
MRLFLGVLFAHALSCFPSNLHKRNVCTPHPLLDSPLASQFFLDIVLDLPGIHCLPINFQSRLVASAFVIPVGAEAVLLSVMLWSAYH